MPSDLNSFNIAGRPHPLKNTRGGIISEEAARTAHENLRRSLGTNQSEFHPLAVVEDTSSPAFVAISQLYLPLLRAKLLDLHRGQLTGLSGTTAETTSGPIEDVAAVVLATGFDPSPSLSFLSEDVLKAINHAPEYPDLTPALAFHSTHHPSVPGLGFVGFYRGPYWGVAEMQSRFLAELWMPENIAPQSEAMKTALKADRSIENVLAMRGNKQTAQFPMGDYPFLMQEFSTALNLPISPSVAPQLFIPDSSLPLDPLTPARYTSPSANANTFSKSQTAKSLAQAHSSASSALTSTKFIAASIFRNLLGTWHLEREINSKLPSHPSGTFTGTARFLVRQKTLDGFDSPSSESTDPAVISEDGGLEYLYIEEGTFNSTLGFSFSATRRYVYRYDEVTDTLSVWFVRVDDPKRADYLFHDVEFLPREEDDDAGDGAGAFDSAGVHVGAKARGVKAKAGHLCGGDYYSVEYEFGFKAVNLERWTTGYQVKGPKKDYTLHAVYTRD